MYLENLLYIILSKLDRGSIYFISGRGITEACERMTGRSPVQLTTKNSSSLMVTRNPFK